MRVVEEAVFSAAVMVAEPVGIYPVVVVEQPPSQKADVPVASGPNLQCLTIVVCNKNIYMVRRRVHAEGAFKVNALKKRLAPTHCPHTTVVVAM